MQKFKDFLKSINIDISTMGQNSKIDISNLNKKILSYNHSTNQNEYRKINKIIRKKDAMMYSVVTENDILQCTLDHKFYTDSKKYESLNEIINKGFHTVSILDKNNVYKIIKNIDKLEKMPVFDLEVDINHNLFTNNLLSHNSMGDPTTVSGGKAIPFYAHCRIRITRSEIDRELQQNVMKFTVIKNKMAAPFKVGTVVYKWNQGFDFSSEIAQLAIEFGVIKNEKSSYFLPDSDLKFVGKKRLIAYLDDNPEYTKQVIEPLVVNVLESSDDTLRLKEDNENTLY